jgi:large subunit ribosomal protein L6
MKQKMSESIELPEGIACDYKDKTLVCKKGSFEISKKIASPGIVVKVKEKTIEIECKKGNKSDFNKVMSFVAHINNLFRGLLEGFTYKLELANVHFPMSLKTDKDKFLISNFLGEKLPREAKILPNVQVKVSGQQITITSVNREAAGQTAANIENATKVNRRDRRIFQDGIFITEKPGRKF